MLIIDPKLSPCLPEDVVSNELPDDNQGIRRSMLSLPYVQEPNFEPSEISTWELSLLTKLKYKSFTFSLHVQILCLSVFPSVYPSIRQEQKNKQKNNNIKMSILHTLDNFVNRPQLISKALRN